MIDYGDGGAIGGMNIGRRIRSTQRKPAPVPFYPLQIPHDHIQARHNINKITWTSPDGKYHNKIVHIMIAGDGIYVYLVSDHSGQQIVILITIWWWQI
jgi:hypothetical protein